MSLRANPTFEIGSVGELQSALNAWAGLAGEVLEDVARRGKPLPPLFESGVVYRREKPGREVWQTPAQTYRKLAGDCEDLATWRVAELRRAGYPAKVRVKRGGFRLWHIYVRYFDGTRWVDEDPSKLLGMKGPA
jgi:hypothetical protein